MDIGSNYRRDKRQNKKGIISNTIEGHGDESGCSNNRKGVRKCNGKKIYKCKEEKGKDEGIFSTVSENTRHNRL